MVLMQHKKFCVREFIKNESATAAFERSPRKSIRRASRELGIRQQTVYNVPKVLELPKDTASHPRRHIALRLQSLDFQYVHSISNLMNGYVAGLSSVA